ncbi:exosortase U [Stieleria sp. ICT_E10.1]|uniref:exosortase U n=1 Tax=Stieleria sedimenti TaxID=2976331 RepID=UPI00218018A2|nr:exosortase U [Stieleria sedimenti]MCS7471463.1 exosortase U [Stieleria sedimenti]
METPTQPKYHAAAFWAVVLLAPLPGLSVYLAWLSELEQYGYVFPLILALIALVLFRWDYQFRMPGDASSIGLVALGVTLNLFASYRASPWLTAIAFAMTAAGWLRTHLSSAPDRHRLTYLSLLLVMMIRLPLNRDLALAAALQRVTSRVSSYLLDSFGVTHYLRGNVIELPGGTLFVEEACSGVQSLFTVLFLVCLWIVFRRRPLIATPAYLLAGMLWAMVMNVVRITSIALAQEWYSIDLSAGTPHEALGWICLSGAVLMMLSTDRLLRVMFFPVPPDESGAISNPASKLWNWLLVLGVPEENDAIEAAQIGRRVTSGGVSKPLGTALLVGALLLCLPSLAMGYRIVATRFDTQLAKAERPLLWDPGSSLMNRTGYASAITDHQMLRDANSKQLGNHADVWTVFLDGMAVRIAVSQPYPEWHDMRLCYSGNGWQVNDWIAMLPPTGTRTDESSQPINHWAVSYAEMVRDTGEFGTLLFCGLTSDRQLLSPPMSGFYSLFDDRMKDRQSLQSNIIMLQLWTETQKPLMPEQLAELRELFDSFRLTVLEELNPDPKAPQSAGSANLTMVTDNGGNR